MISVVAYHLPQNHVERHIRLFIAKHFDSSNMLIFTFQCVLTKFSLKLNHCITNRFNEEKRKSCEQTNKFMIPTSCSYTHQITVHLFVGIARRTLKSLIWRR